MRGGVRGNLVGILFEKVMDQDVGVTIVAVVYGGPGRRGDAIAFQWVTGVSADGLSSWSWSLFKYVSG